MCNGKASQNKQAVMVVGPTASGKTAAAIELAKIIDGEIISADSMQIYRGMDIGTAKPTKAEMQGVVHHLIDEIEPDEPYAVSIYQKKALALIDDILKRGKKPIITGGTGLYINALCCDLDFSKASPDEAYRQKLKALKESEGLFYLHEMLKQKSPQDALRIHPNDEKRIIRRLEIIHQQKNGEYDFLKPREGYSFLLIGLTMDRHLLYERINARVDRMAAQGLEAEVRSLYHKFGAELQSLKGIGYKEMIAAFEGSYTMKEAYAKIKQATRNFAKRQMTWFSRDKRIKWFNSTYYSCLKEMIDDIINYIKKEEK